MREFPRPWVSRVLAPGARKGIRGCGDAERQSMANKDMSLA